MFQSCVELSVFYVRRWRLAEFADAGRQLAASRPGHPRRDFVQRRPNSNPQPERRLLRSQAQEKEQANAQCQPPTERLTCGLRSTDLEQQASSPGLSTEGDGTPSELRGIVMGALH